MTKTHIFCLAIIWAALCFPGNGRCEFYRYVDKNGHAVYVDDPAKIPEQFWQDIDKYAEETDGLSEKEKAALAAEKNWRSQQRRIKRDQALEAEKKQRSVQQAARDIRLKQDTAKQEFKKKQKTRIQVALGQVIVPVLLGAGGRKTSAGFILDTGASMTVIYEDVAEKLGIIGGRSVKVQVVGGSLLPARFVTLDFIEVGPHKKLNVPALVIKNQGIASHKGLLGMEFLRGLDFSVDFENQFIIWGPGA